MPLLELLWRVHPFLTMSAILISLYRAQEPPSSLYIAGEARHLSLYIVTVWAHQKQKHCYDNCTSDVEHLKQSTRHLRCWQGLT